MDHDSVQLIVVQWWWAGPVLLALIWVWGFIQWHTKQQHNLRSALASMAVARASWVSAWRHRLQDDISAPAQTVKGALAAVDAAQKQAATDWLDNNTSEALLHMEWFFDRTASVWAYTTHVRANEDEYEAWRSQWERVRASVNPLVLSHNQFFASTLGRMLGRTAGWTPAIDWIDENAHRRRVNDLAQWLSSESDQ